MAVVNLTKRTIDSAAPEDKPYYLYCDKVSGFGLRVMPTGIKTFIFQFRVGHGRNALKQRTVIGRYGSPWTVETARREAQRLGGIAATGTDPAATRIAEEAATKTVAELCSEYLKVAEAGQMMVGKKLDSHPKTATTVMVDRGRIHRHIIPLIGKKPMQELTENDVQQMLFDIAAGKTATVEKTGPRGLARVTGGKTAATRAVGLLGGIFSWAIKQKYCTTNPVKGVQIYKGRTRERYLTAEETARLGTALKNALAAEKNPYAITAVQLLLLTGCRKMEVLSLKWEYVDLDQGCLLLPDSKTGQKIVQLGDTAVGLLEKVPRLANNPYVFPSRSKSHYVGLAKFFGNIKADAKLQGFRLHDLRHSFASTATENGFSLQYIGTLLGHKDSKTTLRYAHLGQTPVKTAADKISRGIAASLNRTQKGRRG